MFDDRRRALPLTAVAVPGLGLDTGEWRAVSRHLLRDRAGLDLAAVAPLPGYGRRPGPGEDLRPSVQGAQLAEQLHGASVLVGHSASCQVVARAAALAPERIRALVLIGPTTDPTAASWPRLAQRWLRTAAWERPGQVPTLVRSYTRTGLGGMRRAMEAARHEDIRTDLHAVRCPVLVLRGRHDRICPERWAHELVALSPSGSRAVTLPRGAHMVPLTHGAAVASAVSGFLG